MDEDLGQATVVYEGPDGDTEERTLENENVAYFQDHWLLKIDERDGSDVVRRIPAERVYHVERTVDEFEDEVATFRTQVESFADDLRQTLLGGGEDDDAIGGGSDGRGATGRDDDPAERDVPEDDDDGPTTVDVTDAEPDDRR